MSRKKAGRGFFGWLKLFFKLGVAGLLLAIGGGVGAYFYYSRGLPSVESLRTYRPPQVSKVYCADGSLCTEYFRERRTWVDIQMLPAHVKNAFLAAEDAGFYKHQGLDYFGILRAGIKVFLPGGHATGASTISQQVCRNMVLHTQERKLARKIREWILTPRMEKALDKDQILALYVNQVDFGHSRWGVEEAALFYFGKHAKDLSVGEAASLAGTVQSPERINPVTNMVRAKERQKYVLTQLVRHNFLPKNIVDPEMEKPILLAPRPPEPVGAYYAEEIRRTLQARYGDELLLAGGLRIDIAMNPKLQAAAENAERGGLEALDRKMGFSGPLAHMDSARFGQFKGLLKERIEQSGKRHKDEVKIADLAHLAEATSRAKTDAPAVEEEGSEKIDPDAEDEAARSPDIILAGKVQLRALEQDMRAIGYVTKVDDSGKKATVDLVSRVGEIAFSTIGWARPRAVGKWSASPTKMSDVLKPGDFIRVRVMKVNAPNQPLELTLDQIPEVQGAMVAIDPANRHVVAMVGGYDFNLSSFNRATQAKRQPGSSFKPFLYASAIMSQKYTPLTIVNDAPEPIRDPYTGKVWKPQNYERTGFEGPMTLRQALTKSKNTVSVRLIEALTPEVAIDFAKRAGIHSALPDNLTLALGTGEVAVLEIANAYATLRSLGQYSDPILLVKVTDAKGRVLEEHQPAFEETLPPAVAFLATSLMRSVVEDQGGTGGAVRELARPAVGKTGTASEYRDAWFSGYTMDYVVSAWVGFDDHSSLGSGMTGGHAALPVWLNWMKEAEEGLPSREFEIPPGVQQVRVDPSTGLLAGNAMPGRLEPFLEGTAPTETTTGPDKVDPNDFSKGGGL